MTFKFANGTRGYGNIAIGKLYDNDSKSECHGNRWASSGFYVKFTPIFADGRALCMPYSQYASGQGTQLNTALYDCTVSYGGWFRQFCHQDFTIEYMVLQSWASFTAFQKRCSFGQSRRPGFQGVVGTVILVVFVMMLCIVSITREAGYCVTWGVVRPSAWTHTIISYDGCFERCWPIVIKRRSNAGHCSINNLTDVSARNT
ncbi:hypothetical protein CY34DRAFT_107028 [Suillus luteus UH-Slu-Lm8-n1]|uniref:Uncharacterized protein n=1 Tax=Suillus luteus UH-Slu-Lm8-n1 TaxID=930992 RepID=A0A0D0AJQ5_9AGAM|nr:hypothetical protein CY34DRAFT_107028 [Suillus luteus UH-Slu-Lm8-n1]